MIVHDYNLNIVPGGVPLTVRLSQYDSDISLVFRLYASKGDFLVEDGTTVEIRGRKPNGETFAHAGTVSGNMVTIPFYEDMTDVSGKTVCEITLEHDQKSLSTSNFYINIEPVALDKRTRVPVFITFWNGEYLLLQMEVENGADAVYPNDPPERPETERYFYEFDGWSKKTDDNIPDDDALLNLTKARAVYACFITHTKSRIIYYNRTVQVSEDIIIDSADAVYNGEIPTIPSTENNTFTFAGWSFLDDNRLNVNSLKHVDEPTRTVYAVFTITGPTFTVDFVYNGVTLQSSIVPYGGDAHYTSLVPEKSSTSSKDYGFSGWSLTDDNTVDEGALTNVLENRTLYPCFVVTHTRAIIVFWFDATKLEEQLIRDGADAVYQGSTPVKASTDYEDYAFNGWSRDSNDNTPDADALTAVVEDRNVYACFRVSHFRAYITFWNDTEEIATYTVTDGANSVYEEAIPVKPSTPNWDYGFTGWSRDSNDNTVDDDALLAVTTDRNVYACFEVIHTHATITFWNGDKQLRTLTIVDWGDAEYTGSEPKKASTEYQDYEFNGWSLGQDDNTPDENALREVITDRNVYACFRVSHSRAYVTFWNGETELRKVTVTDGADAEYNGSDPRRQGDAHNTYTFIGWSLNSDDNTVEANALKNVTADRNVYACFQHTTSGMVTFWNGETQLLVETVTGGPSGGTATYADGETPEKDAEYDHDHEEYIFIGWSLGQDDNTVDTNALKFVKDDRDVYACYQHNTLAHLKFYRYTFYSSLNTQLIVDLTVRNGGDGVYPFTAPTQSADDFDTSYTFMGWARSVEAEEPDSNALKSVTSDRNVYTFFRGAHEIMDSWSTINSYAKAGTIGSHYSVGQYKRYSGFAGNPIKMKIKYIRSGYKIYGTNNYAEVVFISHQGTLSHRWGAKVASVYHQDTGIRDYEGGILGGWGDSELRQDLQGNWYVFDTAMKSRGATLRKVMVPFEQPVSYTANVQYYSTPQYFWGKESATSDDIVWIPTLNECSAEHRYTNVWVRDLPPDFTDTSRQFQGDGFTSYKNAVELYDDINKAYETSGSSANKLDVDRAIDVMFMFAL